jgi:predicted acyltransferase
MDYKTNMTFSIKELVSGHGRVIEKPHAETKPRTKPHARLISLDAFRGLSIILMLLVNNYGSQAPTQLRHHHWGEMIHLADLAFPWFLLCVGVAIPFSAASFKKKHLPEWHLDVRILRRTFLLILIGAVMDSTDERGLVFFSIGVLQTIALAYMFAALLYDLPVYRRISLAALGLVAYWAAIKYLPIPGQGSGFFEEQRNFIFHLNSTYFGQLGLWNLPRVVPTTALVLIGTAIGDLIRWEKYRELEKSLSLIGAGILMLAAGVIWGHSLGFNKWVWTPSFILFSGGTGTMLLGLMHLVIDAKGWNSKWSKPFVIFGSNAILAYFAPVVVKSVVLGPLNIDISGWLGVTLFILFWYAVMWALYRKKIFLRV